MVGTINRPQGPWDTSLRVAIGELLLERAEPCTAAELARSLGGHQSNIKKIADGMEEDGLLVRQLPPERPLAKGRPPSSAYALRSDRREDLEAALERSPQPGTLRAGQQLVFASAASADVLALMEAATESAAAARMSWAAFVDGETQECVVAFDGEDALVLAGDLMAVLVAAKVPSRRATVAGVSERRSFLRDAARKDLLATRRPQRHPR